MTVSLTSGLTAVSVKALKSPTWLEGNILSLHMILDVRHKSTITPYFSTVRLSIKVFTHIHDIYMYYAIIKKIR